MPYKLRGDFFISNHYHTHHYVNALETIPSSHGHETNTSRYEKLAQKFLLFLSLSRGKWYVCQIGIAGDDHYRYPYIIYTIQPLWRYSYNESLTGRFFFSFYYLLLNTMKTTQQTTSLIWETFIETRRNQAAIQELLFFAQQTQRTTQIAACQTLDTQPTSIPPTEVWSETFTPTTGLSKNWFRRL